MIYAYDCAQCGGMFAVRATAAEKESGLDLCCPRCGGRHVAEDPTGVGVPFGGVWAPRPRRRPRPAGGGAEMVYSYECDKCGAMFTVQATVAEKEKGLDLRCPSCGVKEVTQNLRGVGMTFGKGGPVGPGCGPGCCS